MPYCRAKCIYCDFYSGGTRVADFPRLVTALLQELRERRDELPARVETLYFGGGTPSSLSAEHFRELCVGLENQLGRLSDLREITVEVNPEDVTPELADAWRDNGVNRVSMGVQSLSAETLKFLKRRHTPAVAVKAYETLRQRFGNVSIDLMFGIPGQTMAQWEETIRGAVALRPEHISCYTLMYEEGTALTLLRDKGVIAEADDDENAAMYDILRRLLREEGYEHYEISNFALPGYRSLHNYSYWTGLPYLGLGPSAHSYDGKRIRRANPADLHGYLSRFAPAEEETSGGCFCEEERLTYEELREEYILTRMRTACGIELADFTTRFGERAAARLRRNAENAHEGALNITEKSISLSESGILTCDATIVDLAM